jgi:hypothetical protein
MEAIGGELINQSAIEGLNSIVETYLIVAMNFGVNLDRLYTTRR